MYSPADTQVPPACHAVCAVHDGYVLQKSICRSPVAGRVLSQCMLSSVTSKGAVVRPRYAIKKVEHKPGEFHVRTAAPSGHVPVAVPLLLHASAACQCTATAPLLLAVCRAAGLDAQAWRSWTWGKLWHQAQQHT
jgi:hypothetical protein